MFFLGASHAFSISFSPSDFMQSVLRTLQTQNQRMERMERFLEQLVLKENPGQSIEEVEAMVPQPVETLAGYLSLDQRLQTDGAFRSKLVSCSSLNFPC